MIRKTNGGCDESGLTRFLILATAQRAAAITHLAAVVAYVDRVGGFMTAEDQQMLRDARALLVECEGWGKP